MFHETLRKHSPAPIVPPRYVHEDTQIGGYHIPAGTEVNNKSFFHYIYIYIYFQENTYICILVTDCDKYLRM